MGAKVQDARRRVTILRRALLSPSAGDLRHSLPELMEAVRCLGSLLQDVQLQGANPGRDQEDLANELAALRNDLRNVERLIGHSLEFYEGWAKLLGSATGGYISSGESAPLTAPAAVCVQG